MAEETSKKEETFRLEEGFEKIEQLLEKLSDREVSLEDSFSLYQEGMELLKQCNARIEHVEKQMLAIDEEGQTHEFFRGTEGEDTTNGRDHKGVASAGERTAAGDHGSDELQRAGRRQEAPPAAHAGDLPDVRRKRGYDPSVYGGHGDDPHLFSGA